ncbi:glucose-6-phosphate exchanger SLC37A1 [Fukomys damarensis]|uniref:glucose-6-phosphate exchanger SLC37A1 n=1 Tax=Fukomys damarensis TaxID=885580 RepID=UPI000540207E|nr:glucose-6-phosphate exchanger SLC37A1 [Fukomys damarensis]XP_010634789.1 glucose-6-phosphate exchanger SLC37A1 [Fukomys damarensis]XP_010634790.1 glucose-6-phosphate exchanger SLC37A1 [Fukomys damarensis]XP_010634791.1 glucose-6-phosphate exchanger SLC37A1 [Fukomys damarensis]XP_010634792.1 glucose-6-phosphate exchanger SLC37A1 [Fukomys damarensis]XP_010634793.1 glucose-6-phosphate exchanger SLC37A1 [Fukomys damarensis]
MAPLPAGIRLIASFSRDQWYRAFIFTLTYLLYASFHLSRKPISIVKGELHKHCTSGDEAAARPSHQSDSTGLAAPHQLQDNGSDCGWAPFDKDNYQQLLGALDYSFLCAYAVGMYLSGILGERLPIRYYLTFGMLASGAFTALFGLGYFYDIHSLGFYVVAQVINGLVQTTGWPSVVTCLGNWFGKGRRGLIMGVWNSHTSVGNILGSLIAGYWVSTCWGLSFMVPGAIVATMGIVCFLFLVEHPKDIRCTSTLTAHSKAYENGTNRFRLQKPMSHSEKSRPLDPEMQCLLLSHGKTPIHPSHVVVLPGDSGHGTAAISFTGALRIPGVIEFSLCLLFAKLVSYTFLFWLPLYITSVDHLDAQRAGELSTLFDVGGLFGGILAGVVSDRLEKRASTCGLMLLLAAPTLYVFSAVSRMGLEATVAMLLLSGALVSGPYALITTAVSADLGTHKSLKGNSHALSTVTAIIDGTGSVGAALGPLLAGLLSPSGWSNVFYMLMFADACALLFLVRLIHKELSCPGPAAGNQAPLKEH